MTITPIPTEYGGVVFRSRLEARWACWLDALEITWVYESQGYDLGAARYLPDFTLPDIGLVIEVKPPCSIADREDIRFRLPLEGRHGTHPPANDARTMKAWRASLLESERRCSILSEMTPVALVRGLPHLDRHRLDWFEGGRLVFADGRVALSHHITRGIVPVATTEVHRRACSTMRRACLIASSARFEESRNEMCNAARPQETT